MKSLCFIIEDISRCGGSERICLLVASELCRRGYLVRILSLHGNCKPYFEYNHDVRISCLNTRLEKYFFQSHPRYTILKLKCWCSIYKPSIVIDTCLLMGNITIPAIKGLNIKHVSWDNFSYEFFRRVHHEKVALEKMKKNGSYLITLTACDRELFIKEQHYDADLIQYISNPITIDMEVPMEHHGKKVISVGRFAHEKGFDMLLKAWEIVERTVDDWSLEIWGDTGEDTGDVWKTYNSLDLKRASLHPATSKISEKYKEASIYVLPSRHEGFGLVLLEASVMSLPLIAFDCPNGPREIVKDGVNGLLVEANNVESLANAIIRLIKDDEARKRMGKSAFEMSKSFSLEKIANQWQELFENL